CDADICSSAPVCCNARINSTAAKRRGYHPSLALYHHLISIGGKRMNRNLFATVLTYAAPSSNYRGESEENRTVLQKITRGGHEYTVISPESMRNALREILAKKGLKMNRRRLHDQDQLAVEFQGFPDAATYADDFLF